MRLTDKVALLTGAAGGIGRTMALLFAQEGAKVVIADLLDEQGRQTAHEIEAAGGRALFVHADVSKAEDVKGMVRVTTETLGRLDVLVNNAAIWEDDADVLELEEAVWDRVIAVTLKGVYLCSKAAIPEMIKAGGGSIVVISSVNALFGIGLDAYSAAKAGVISLTRNMAVHYGRHRIRVNVICPGTIDSHPERFQEYRERDPDFFERLLRMYPIGRIGRPEDIAFMALYLASDESSFTTGSVLVVDGGVTAGFHFLGPWRGIRRE